MSLLFIMLAGATALAETPDPTRPPEGTTSKPAKIKSPCVEMVLVAADRRMVLVDGVRLQEGDVLPAGIIRQINHNGIIIDDNGQGQRYPVGNCPVIILPVRENEP